MAPERKPPTQRKSLRQSLRDLLTCRRRRSQVDQPRFIGSGILRKADPTTMPLLPAISSVSLFPDFGSSVYDADQFSISIPTSIKDFSHGEILIVSDYSVNNSTTSLLPATRLSQFNLHQSFVNKANSPKRVQYGEVPDILIGGASRQASFESSVTSAQHSSSTLRLQSSLPSLESFHTESETVTSPRTIGLGIRRSNSRQGLPAGIRNLGKPLKPRVSGGRSTRGHGLRHSTLEHMPTTPLGSIKHFSSFCVLDTLTPGCPVTATSEDLRYIFDVGEPFFLHNQECEGTSFDVVTGHDAAGAEITHLVLFSPLVSPSSGRSRFLLAALIDVTAFLREAATLPELETISEASFEDDELPTPRRPTPHPPWTDRGFELSAEDLLGGCYVECVTENKGLDKSHDARFTEDIWLRLATEEKKKGSSSRGCRSSPASPVSFGSVPTASTASSVVDSVLEEFMSSLQQLYSEFFVLAKSPLDDHFYEICNVSPSVSTSRDYVHGHLSHTPECDIAALSEQLGGDTAFSILVRWGSKGREERLYCVPLFGQSSITWICILVDAGMDSLW